VSETGSPSTGLLVPLGVAPGLHGFAIEGSDTLRSYPDGRLRCDRRPGVEAAPGQTQGSPGAVGIRNIDGGFVNAHGGVPSAPAVGLLKERAMNGLIYLVGLVVVILFILSFLGLR
jgi:hypothetical protein